MSLTVDVNGLQLFYRDHGAGTPLLLLHGFTDTADRRILPASSDSPMSHETSSRCSITLASIA
jgi:pimeloyl-ACP methyl ester carboxylesterase